MCVRISRIGERPGHGCVGRLPMWSCPNPPPAFDVPGTAGSRWRWTPAGATVEARPVAGTSAPRSSPNHGLRPGLTPDPRSVTSTPGMGLAASLPRTHRPGPDTTANQASSPTHGDRRRRIARREIRVSRTARGAGRTGVGPNNPQQCARSWPDVESPGRPNPCLSSDQAAHAPPDENVMNLRARFGSTAPVTPASHFAPSRAVTPAPRDNTPLGLTVLCGIGGVCIGYWIAGALGVAHTSGVDWTRRGGIIRPNLDFAWE